MFEKLQCLREKMFTADHTLVSMGLFLESSLLLICITGKKTQEATHKEKTTQVYGNEASMPGCHRMRYIFDL